MLRLNPIARSLRLQAILCAPFVASTRIQLLKQVGRKTRFGDEKREYIGIEWVFVDRRPKNRTIGFT